MFLSMEQVKSYLSGERGRKTERDKLREREREAEREKGERKTKGTKGAMVRSNGLTKSP